MKGKFLFRKTLKLWKLFWYPYQFIALNYKIESSLNMDERIPFLRQPAYFKRKHVSFRPQRGFILITFASFCIVLYYILTTNNTSSQKWIWDPTIIAPYSLNCSNFIPYWCAGAYFWGGRTNGSMCDGQINYRWIPSSGVNLLNLSFQEEFCAKHNKKRNRTGRSKSNGNIGIEKTA